MLLGYLNSKTCDVPFHCLPSWTWSWHWEASLDILTRSWHLWTPCSKPLTSCLCQLSWSKRSIASTFSSRWVKSSLDSSTRHLAFYRMCRTLVMCFLTLKSRTLCLVVVAFLYGPKSLSSTMAEKSQSWHFITARRKRKSCNFKLNEQELNLACLHYEQLNVNDTWENPQHKGNTRLGKYIKWNSHIFWVLSL